MYKSEDKTHKIVWTIGLATCAQAILEESKSFIVEPLFQRSASAKTSSISFGRIQSVASMQMRVDLVARRYRMKQT